MQIAQPFGVDFQETRIFLNYAREDIAEVERVYDNLREMGFAPWMDTRDILAGEDWERSIDRAIRRADFFVVFLSNHSVAKRGVVQKEIKQALEIWREKLADDIYLIPVRLNECEIPESLRRFHYIDLFAAGGPDKLRRAIDTGIERRNPASPDAMERPTISSHRLADADARGRYNIEIAYPRIEAPKTRGTDEANGWLTGWVIDRAQAFRRQPFAITAGDDEPLLSDSDATGGELSVSYETMHFDSSVLSVRFLVYSYSLGAAHGMTNTHVHNFQFSPFVLLHLSDLFVRDSGYLRVLSDFCNRELTLKLENDGFREDEWIRRGTAPEASNYRAVSVAKSGLVVTFDPYDVAPYAAGIQEVVIPYATIAHILKRPGPLTSIRW